MKKYVAFVLLGLGILVMYSNCGQVGESGFAVSGSLQDGNAVAGGLIYNVDAAKPACLTCHGPAGTAVLGVDLKTFSDEDIETALRSAPSGMPLYDFADISEQQLLHLIAYIRTL